MGLSSVPGGLVIAVLLSDSTFCLFATFDLPGCVVAWIFSWVASDGSGGTSEGMWSHLPLTLKILLHGVSVALAAYTPKYQEVFTAGETADDRVV